MVPILESRNRHADRIDIPVACVNTLIALALESTLQSPIELPRGRLLSSKGEKATYVMPSI